jgi:predicted TIM-barrel fold metal-dependent hydrolase
MNCSSAIVREFLANGRSQACPIIDMHGHYGPFGWVCMPRCEAAGMLHSMDRAGVKALVLAAHEGLTIDTRAGNAITGELALRYPGRFFGYWSVNPNTPDVIAKDLKVFDRQKGFLGFKFLSDYHQYPLTGIAYAPALEYANDRGLCVMMHTWGYSPFDGPEMVHELARKYPKVRLIMGHSGYGQWDVSIAAARDFEHVYLELTAVYATHDGIALKWAPERNFGIGVNGIIERMVAEAGSHKILFGTDLPWYSPHYAAGAVIFSRIDDNDMHNILHRNAERIFSHLGISLVDHTA